MTTASPAAMAVRFFGSLREAIGAEAVAVDFAGGTVATLKARLRDQLPAAAAQAALAAGVQVAVNQVLAPSDDTPIAPGDEVALLPPVTGG